MLNYDLSFGFLLLLNDHLQVLNGFCVTGLQCLHISHNFIFHLHSWHLGLEHQRQELFKFLVLSWDFFVTAGWASGLLTVRVRLALRLERGVNFAFKQTRTEELFVNAGFGVCLQICVQTSDLLRNIAFSRFNRSHERIIALISVAS